MRLIKFEETKHPEIYTDMSDFQLIHSSIYKIGRTEVLKLINEIYIKSLKEYGNAIQLKFINQGFSNTILLRICIGNIKAETLSVKKKFILKLGKYDDVHAEAQNYKKLISSLDLSFVPKLITYRSIIKRWAAILYEDLGEIETFQDYFIRENNANNCVKYLDMLFDKLEESWYREATISRNKMYSEQFNLIQSIDKYKEANKDIVPDIYNIKNIKLPIQNYDIICKNPIYFLYERMEEHPFIINTSTVHGDMHGANILVDEKNVFLIDFANMQADGHIFKDYVKLEANIIFRLFDYDASKQENSFNEEWLKFIAACLGYDIDVKSNVEIIKAKECIRKIRSRAYNLKEHFSSTDTWQIEYLIGLLHWTLSSIYWTDIFLSKKKLAFYVSALICDTIEKAEKNEIEILK